MLFIIYLFFLKRKKSDVEVVHHDKNLITKVKSYENVIKINLLDKGLPLEKSQCLTYLVVFIDSVYRSDKRFYPPALLEGCII